MKTRELIKLAFNNSNKKITINRIVAYVEGIKEDHKRQIETIQKSCEVTNKIVLEACGKIIKIGKDSKEGTVGYYTGSIHKKLEELRKCAVKLGSTINKEEIDHFEKIKRLASKYPNTYDEIENIYNHCGLYSETECILDQSKSLNIDPLIIMNISDNIEYKPKDWKILTQEEIQELLNQNKTTYWSTPNQQEKIKLQDGGWFDKSKAQKIYSEITTKENNLKENESEYSIYSTRKGILVVYSKNEFIESWRKATSGDHYILEQRRYQDSEEI